MLNLIFVNSAIIAECLYKFIKLHRILTNFNKLTREFQLILATELLASRIPKPAVQASSFEIHLCWVTNLHVKLGDSPSSFKEKKRSIKNSRRF